jgi:pimeloyl-ACP methyl ester carboxylesterase
MTDRAVYLALLILSSAVSAGTQGTTTDSMVDVGGYRLSVRQEGAANPGVPTVVFENGLGAQLRSWTRVQEQIGQVTRTIAYDRAGVGASELGKDLPTPANIARQLHALLAKLEAPPPYILVGHSYGGPLSHTFAAMYPKEVAGLVYVDPTDFTQTVADHRDLWTKAGAPDGTGRAWEIKASEQALPSVPPGIQAEVREVMKAQESGFAAAFRGDAPDVPIVILLAGQKPALPPGPPPPGDFDKFTNAMKAQRLDHFGNLTQRAKNGMLLLVGPAGHFIQATEPDTVAWAIRRVLNLASAK